MFLNEEENENFLITERVLESSKKKKKKNEKEKKCMVESEMKKRKII